MSVHHERDDCSAAGLQPQSLLANLTLNEIEQQVGMLTAALSRDQLLHWLTLSAVLVQRAKELRHRVEEVAIGWIKAHGQIECGTILYTVGYPKTVKCIDVFHCMELLLEACGGDVQVLCQYLAANPYKQGSCARLLTEEQFQSVFIEQRQDKLVLKPIDTRFISRPGHVGGDVSGPSD
jgi:hypothetical protein